MNENSNISLLIEKCKSGDTKAQFAIYKMFYKAMFNTAFRIINNKEEAEDVMQESFLKAFTCLETLKDANMFPGWIKQLVIRQSLNNVRKNSKWELDSVSDNLIMVDESDNELDFQKDTLAMKDKILSCIAKLKPNYRVAISLYFIEGYDLEEMSEILNLTNGNCRTLISRAKSSLKNNMKLYEIQ